MYLVPLPASAPLPEFIELLNHVKLPKQRDANMLLGVFILNKGRVVVPPLHPATTVTNIPGLNQPTATAAPQPSTQNDAMSSLFSTLGTGPPPAMPYGLPPPMLPGMPSAPPPGLTYPYAPPHMAAPPPVVAPSADALTALTSSIKSMTPDQINLILKGLTMPGPIAPPPSWPQPGMPSANQQYPPAGMPRPESYPSPSRSPQWVFFLVHSQRL